MVLEEVVGENDFFGVIGVWLMNVVIGNIKDFVVDGVFVVIGYVLIIELFKGQIDMNDCGYIDIVFDLIVMSIFGVYVVGDVIDEVYC